MSELNLGKLIGANEKPQRDATHIAVAPATAAEFMEPGTHCVIDSTGQARLGPGEPVGIVDPFLRHPVRPQQRFWLFLYPKTVTNLRHHWTHPAFESEKPQPSADEQWIRDFAESVGLSYAQVMDGARNWIESAGADYLNFGGLLEGKTVPEEFWEHYEALTGKTGRGSFFTCSC